MICFALPYGKSLLHCWAEEIYIGRNNIDKLSWFDFQVVIMHAFYKMKDPQLDLLESFLNVYVYVCHEDLV